MKRRILQIAATVVAFTLLASPAAAYDREKAESFAEMFSLVQGAKAGKYLHMIKPDQFVQQVRAGKPFVTLDVRTPGETQFYTANLPGHLVIPLNELFTHDQLARLPQDKPIVVMCASGVRATAAATALRTIGFEQTYVLKGGFKGLTAYLGTKEANQPLGPRTSAN